MLISFSLSNFLRWERSPGVVGTAENLGLDKGMNVQASMSLTLHGSGRWGKTVTCQTRGPIRSSPPLACYGYLACPHSMLTVLLTLT